MENGVPSPFVFPAPPHETGLELGETLKEQYHAVADELKGQLIVHRDRFHTFDEALETVTTLVHERCAELQAAPRRRLLKIIIHCMYVNIPRRDGVTLRGRVGRGQLDRSQTPFLVTRRMLHVDRSFEPPGKWCVVGALRNRIVYGENLSTFQEPDDRGEGAGCVLPLHCREIAI